jgi:MFS superfamily sulfate permease-like transporter
MNDRDIEPARSLGAAWLSAKLAARDLQAGVTVAAYLVPQMMAYAEVAGLAAVTAVVASDQQNYAATAAALALAVGAVCLLCCLARPGSSDRGGQRTSR